MALPTFGSLAILDAVGTSRSIGREVDGNAIPGKSLCALGNSATGLSIPHGMLEFYGYSNTPSTTNVRWCKPSVTGDNILAGSAFCGCCCNCSYFQTSITSCLRSINQGNTVGFSVGIIHGSTFGGGGTLGAGPTCGSYSYGNTGGGGFNQFCQYTLAGISTTGRSCIIFWGCFT